MAEQFKIYWAAVFVNWSPARVGRLIFFVFWYVTEIHIALYLGNGTSLDPRDAINTPLTLTGLLKFSTFSLVVSRPVYLFGTVSVHSIDDGSEAEIS